MNRWVDAHCHLQIVEDAPKVVLARYPQVDWFVVSGLDAFTSALGVEMARQFPDRVLATVGVHPYNAEQWPTERDQIVEMARGATAIGETGLDLYRDQLPRKAQIRSFHDHLRLAAELDKPVVVHCRDAFKEVYEVIERSDIGDKVLMHCWSGGPRWTNRFLDLGVRFSFGGPMMLGTNDMVRRGAALIPPERATVGSDTPHFCPLHDPTKASEPAEVETSGAMLAGMWGMEVAEAARITTATAEQIFRTGGSTAGRE